MLGAVIIFVSYYVVALPVGVSLMFATPLKLAGNTPLYCRPVNYRQLTFLKSCAKMDNNILRMYMTVLV